MKTAKVIVNKILKKRLKEINSYKYKTKKTKKRELDLYDLKFLYFKKLDK